MKQCSYEVRANINQYAMPQLVKMHDNFLE